MDLLKVISSCSELTKGLLIHAIKERYGLRRDLNFKVRVIDLLELQSISMEKLINEELAETTFMVEDNLSFRKYWAFSNISLSGSKSNSIETVYVEGEFNPIALDYLRNRLKIGMN